MLFAKGSKVAFKVGPFCHLGQQGSNHTVEFGNLAWSIARTLPQVAISAMAVKIAYLIVLYVGFSATMIRLFVCQLPVSNFVTV